jgi:hypothetical protein
MELISIDRSSLVILKAPTRKSGQIHTPTLIQALQDQFSFAVVPETVEELFSPLEFIQGVHDGFTIAKLGIYNDGIAIVSQSRTEQMDSFAEFLEKWAEEKFEVSLLKVHKADTFYQSTVTVACTKDLLAPIKGLSKIQKSLSKKLLATSDLDVSFATFGLSLSVDEAKMPGSKPVVFRVERKINVEFERGFYVSTAPLTTTGHLELLAELEALG